MGTTALITFQQGEHIGDEYQVYQLHDGAPPDVLESIYAAQKYAWTFPRYEPDEFACAYIRANKDHPGLLRLVVPGCEWDDICYRYRLFMDHGLMHIHVQYGNKDEIYWGPLDDYDGSEPCDEDTEHGC